LSIALRLLRRLLLRGIALLLIIGLCRGVGGLGICLLAIASGGDRGLLNYSNVDNHVISEVFVSSNECVSMLIFETDTFGPSGTRVEAVKVLHGGDY
jgi:hypothetical protein